MSETSDTSDTEKRLEELRIRALPHLISNISTGDLSLAGRLYFDEALRQARAYHEQHPIEEDTGPPPDGGEALQIHRATLEKLRAEHRQQTMQPFLQKGVPLALVEEIVDELVLKEQKPPPPE